MVCSLLVLLCLSSLSLHSHHASAGDSILANQSLSGDQKLHSKGGNFVLGFFPLGNSPRRYYIGIWYNTSIVSAFTTVWVANRANPVLNPSFSQLKFSDKGNLVLRDQSRSLIWSTNANVTSKSTIAVLLDSGNLVLQDGSDGSRILWQSIDHPTDTWLPGAKLGLNKLTGENQRLVAWKNAEDPSPGMFYLEMDPSGISQYVILWNGSENYWSSGIWNGQTFTRVPELRPTDAYSFEYVSNTTENYFTYTVHSTGLISRLVMDYNGQIKSLAWVPASNGWMLFWSKPKEQCQVYKGCGAFGRCNDKNSQHCGCLEGFSEASFEDWNLGDHSGGCVRKTPLQCSGNSSAGTKMDRFYQMDGVKLPANPRSVQAGSIDECETACLSNCSCTAYSYSSGCSLWLEDLLNIQEQYDEAAATLFLRLAASELPTSQSKKGSSIRGVIGGIGGFIVLLSIAWFISWRLQRKRIISAAKTVSDGNLAAFRYGDLQRVTKNFSDKLGSGGFGSVYKGMLPDSTLIAVKKLQDFSQSDKQFRTEVRTIGKVQHKNLIRLHGFCADGNNKCLVYEFMPNTSLDTHLFQSSKTDLDWSRRYQIMLGIARGLAYLHEECRECIIHCDIKPGNILLDDSFIPKVADFGLAKLLGRDLSRVLTTMRGTIGYLAPEWISGIAITAKADVYSYGMMLFEIISGKRNTDHLEDDKLGYFPDSFVKNLINGNAISMLDPRLEGEADVDEVTRTCKVACWCIQDEEVSRPTMGHVVQILEGITEISMPPPPK